MISMFMSGSCIYTQSFVFLRKVTFRVSVLAYWRNDDSPAPDPTFAERCSIHSFQGVGFFNDMIDLIAHALSNEFKALRTFIVPIKFVAQVSVGFS